MKLLSVSISQRSVGLQPVRYKHLDFEVFVVPEYLIFGEPFKLPQSSFEKLA